MSQAFYRKYRSKNLSEVVGQEHITTVLEQALSQGKIAHAYLFTGPRGVGKTSIARILAHQINSLPYSEEQNHPDIIEIDAASNNSVEDIRDLRDRIEVAPFSAKYRVYIIDEVHMLSKSAFNALLKTLEEPPAHAVFILATTDAHKLPATIISRTQQFSFHLISKEKVVEHLAFIAKNEGVKISREALEILAEKGGGSFRDSISLLDQISGLGVNEEISAERVEQILGLAPKKAIFEIIEYFEKQDAGQILTSLENLKNSGTDLKIFVEQFLQEIKQLLPSKPHLVSLITPLTRAKNSHFLEAELIVALIAVPQDFVIAPAVVAPNSGDDSALKSELSAVQGELENLKNELSKIEKPERISKIEATTPAPKIEASKPKTETPAPEKTEKKPEEKPKETPSKIEEKPSETIKEAKTPDAPSETSKEEKITPTGEPQDFDWTAFIRKVKEKLPTTGGILGQSDKIIGNGVIKIYTGYKIKKNQLDKAQNRVILGEALAEIGAGAWEIETFAENKPFEDPTLAAVSEIMGGGIEVNPNE